MLSQQEMSDRLEIQDLVTRYAHAVDDQDWAAFDTIFTPEAIIDYTEVGGARGDREETKKYLAGAMPNFTGFQHLSATTKMNIEGDKATAKTILFNPMIMQHEGQERIFFVGLWYNDTLARTADGWRITSRKEQKSWVYNAPEGLVP